MRAVLIPGDGIGPEVIDAARKVLEATGLPIEWEVYDVGEEAIRRYGTPLPDHVVEAIRRVGVALKGPVTTPIGFGFRSVNVLLRQKLDLYASVRPCKLYPGVVSRFDKVDIVVIRENTEDLYAGVEFEAGSPEAMRIIEMGNGRIRPDSAISIKAISRAGSERIARFAFDYAVKNGRRKVTAVTKANIMKITDGLFLSAARDVAKDYEGMVEYEEVLVDNLCMQLVRRPEDYDVLLLPNLYGDIVSDLCAGLIGGLGMAYGANFGDGIAIFEATHGSAPKYRGLNVVNPTAVILSGAMMLKYLGEEDAARRIEKAVSDVISEGKRVTYDLKGRRDDPEAAKTYEMAEEIARRVKG